MRVAQRREVKLDRVDSTRKDKVGCERCAGRLAVEGSREECRRIEFGEL